MLTIPSWYNCQYEDSLKNAGTHAHQAPQPLWEKWRDRRFDMALQRWTQMIEKWFNRAKAVENPRFQVHCVIAYEHLTSHGLGEDYENCFRDTLPINKRGRTHPDPCVGMTTLHDFAVTLSGLGHDIIGLSQGAGTSPLSKRSPPL
jgi:hypothetical protein